MGALSKLDEFVLNPQVRTCSVAVPGTARNNNSENRETTGDRSSDDPCLEVRYSSHNSGHLNSPDAEDYPHMVTAAAGEIRQYRPLRQKPKKKIPTAPPLHLQENKRRRAPRASHNFALRTSLRQLKHTRF